MPSEIITSSSPDNISREPALAFKRNPKISPPAPQQRKKGETNIKHNQKPSSQQLNLPPMPTKGSEMA
ncbi:hypothetical protein PRZ48_002140 [Zasmidium cellare]|uniref:Uncharacterized protein n=1 Tax=Zasmidium cellare TaxID=395010 RepID=A0ABR0F3Y1_ZASCE|nr:hypothetical protein PRZ48_002140 [Zasmidium cellare]